jgi:RNA polymerase sigma-70 factor (ECF subfamily)
VETSPQPEPGVVNLPAGPGAAEVALEELELVFAFIYARVGNRPDTEDLTQQVAMKAIPRLREGSSTASIRAYLFATARTVLAGFWATRLGMPEDELRDDLALDTPAPEPSGEAAERVDRILSGLPPNYRRVLELRFLRGYSLREVAAEIGSTVGGVKVMQLRALRAAAKVGDDA